MSPQQPQHPRHGLRVAQCGERRQQGHGPLATSRGVRAVSHRACAAAPGASGAAARPRWRTTCPRSSGTTGPASTSASTGTARESPAPGQGLERTAQRRRAPLPPPYPQARDGRSPGRGEFVGGGSGQREEVLRTDTAASRNLPSVAPSWAPMRATGSAQSARHSRISPADIHTALHRSTASGLVNCPWSRAIRSSQPVAERRGAGSAAAGQPSSSEGRSRRSRPTRVSGAGAPSTGPAGRPAPDLLPEQPRRRRAPGRSGSRSGAHPAS